MAVGQGIQTDHDSSLPVAIEVKSSEYSSKILSDDALPVRKPKRKRFFLIILVVGLIAAALGLGLGLGLGLRRKDKNDTNQSNVQPSTSGSPTTVSTPAQPGATDTALQHSILANTSIAAVTLPNGYRHVYLQEQSGAFRRAIYSPQANLWQASADSSLATSAKDNTPLAVARWLDYRDRTNVSIPSFLSPL